MGGVRAGRAGHAAAAATDFALFGEVFDSNPDFLSRFSTELPFPSTLDFRFNGTVGGVVASSAPTDGLRTLFADDDWFTDADSNALGLTKFVGNHDVGRIGWHDPASGHAGRASGCRAPGSPRSSTSRHAATPVVYYGDEQGFTGDGGDQDARQDMFPSQVASYNDDDLIGTDATTADDNFDPDHPLYATIAELAAAAPGPRGAAPGRRSCTATASPAPASTPSAASSAASRSSTSWRSTTRPASTRRRSATDSPSTEFAPLYGATERRDDDGVGRDDRHRARPVGRRVRRRSADPARRRLRDHRHHRPRRGRRGHRRR